MEYTDPAPAAGSSQTGRPRWQTGALLFVLAVLFFSSLVSLRGERTRKSDESARLFLETTLQARQVYLVRNVPGMKQVRQQLLADLKKLAVLQPDAQAIRRLALMQYALDDPGWKASLLRLRGLPPDSAPFKTERELAMWRLALEGRPDAAQAASLRAQIDRMDLGWYEHLALEALYRNAGMQSAARAEADSAQRASLVLMLLMLLFLGVLFVGFLLDMGLVAYVLWRRSHPETPVSRVLEIAPPAPLPLRKADALYAVFLTYLAAFALVRLGALLILSPLLGHTLTKMSEGERALLSLALMVAWLAPPFLVFRWLGRRVGLGFADIGFRSQGVWGDVIWGIGGYVAALPPVLVVNVISVRLFHGIETPLHPAISQFAGAHSALLLMILFTQAVVLAPLLEETLLRGIFFRALAPRAGIVGAILITSGVFALLHPQLPLGFLGLFVLGALFNVLYALRGSLIPSMVAHAINNGAIFLFLTLALGD